VELNLSRSPQRIGGGLTQPGNACRPVGSGIAGGLAAPVATCDAEDEGAGVSWAAAGGGGEDGGSAGAAAVFDVAGACSASAASRRSLTSDRPAAGGSARNG
jgi:hypothetical protein